jgi:gliding motility-associated-like protein
VVETDSILITITESSLEMPNAFSPNDDKINDIYRAKPDKYKSIVEFHAYIFNRHGQKLFEWTDITKGWDGTYNGHPVKDGVYFVYVKARGADGVEYNIRRDVNLIRDHNQTTSSSSNE